VAISSAQIKQVVEEVLYRGASGTNTFEYIKEQVALLMEVTPKIGIAFARYGARHIQSQITSYEALCLELCYSLKDSSNPKGKFDRSVITNLSKVTSLVKNMPSGKYSTGNTMLRRAVEKVEDEVLPIITSRLGGERDSGTRSSREEARKKIPGLVKREASLRAEIDNNISRLGDAAYQYSTTNFKSLVSKRLLSRIDSTAQDLTRFSESASDNRLAERVEDFFLYSQAIRGVMAILEKDTWSSEKIVMSQDQKRHTKPAGNTLRMQDTGPYTPRTVQLRSAPYRMLTAGSVTFTVGGQHIKTVTFDDIFDSPFVIGSSISGLDLEGDNPAAPPAIFPDYGNNHLYFETSSGGEGEVILIPGSSVADVISRINTDPNLYATYYPIPPGYSPRLWVFSDNVFDIYVRIRVDPADWSLYGPTFPAGRPWMGFVVRGNGESYYPSWSAHQELRLPVGYGFMPFFPAEVLRDMILYEGDGSVDFSTYLNVEVVNTLRLSRDDFILTPDKASPLYDVALTVPEVDFDYSASFTAGDHVEVRTGFPGSYFVSEVTASEVKLFFFGQSPSNLNTDPLDEPVIDCSAEVSMKTVELTPVGTSLGNTLEISGDSGVLTALGLVAGIYSPYTVNFEFSGRKSKNTKTDEVVAPADIGLAIGDTISLFNPPLNFTISAVEEKSVVIGTIVPGPLLRISPDVAIVDSDILRFEVMLDRAVPESSWTISKKDEGVKRKHPRPHPRRR